MPRLVPLLAAVGLALGAAGCVPDAALDEVGQVDDGPSSPQQAAAPYLGLTEADALARAEQEGVRARIGAAADVGQPGQTDDYEVGRLTFVVTDGVVTEVVVETETGPVTVATE